MKWIGYGLQGVGGFIALTGMGVFAVGKLVERAASGREDDELASPSDLEVVAVL